MTTKMHNLEVQTPQVSLSRQKVPTTSQVRTPDLWFNRVSKWYGPVIGVNQVSLRLHPGITGLVGANGAGKSTLMRLASGMIRPDIGEVQICGREAWSPEARALLGYCPDVDRFYEEMSGRAFLLTMGKLSGFTAKETRRRTEEVLEQVGMKDRAKGKIRGYSKGMRQRIKFAQALLHDPQVLLLDEPLSGIDPVGRRDFVCLFLGLAAQGKCLLISSHELEELEKLTDQVAIVARGRIAAVGTLPEIRQLLDNYPLSISIGCDEPGRLAQVLLSMEEVIGLDRESKSTDLELEQKNTLIARVRHSQEFFTKFTSLVLEEGFTIDHLEPLDESTHSVLEYLLK